MIVLYVLAGWVGVSLLAYLVMFPFLRMAARNEQLNETAVRETMARPPSHVPSPQQLGYAAVVLERLAQHARTVLGVDRAWILASEACPTVSLAAVAGAGTDPDLIGRRLALGSGARDLHGAASATIHVGCEARGRLCVSSPVDHEQLEPPESQLLEELAGLAGEVLGHHERRQLMFGDSEREIRALVKELAEADGDSYRHSLEVAASARAVAHELGLGEADLVEVQLAALLHDVGKLRVPESVLHKPGLLTPEEQRLMRLHPEWGAEMVARVPGLEPVALIVRLHHERPDGKGYPYGLVGDQIPMASRIVAACSAYGVMTKRWAYRDAVDVDVALSELRRYAGTQFDADVVEALASCLWDSVPVAA